VKKQLIRTLLLFGLVPAVILTILLIQVSSEKAQKVLKKEITSKLIAQRETKKSEIEAYIETLYGQIKTFSNDTMVINAMDKFKSSFKTYREDSLMQLGDEQRKSVENYYTQQFQVRYQSRNNRHSFKVNDAIAQLDDDSIALQYSYISANPEKLGEKDALMGVNNNTTYDQQHQNYHPHFRAYLQEFGFYDIFLVDADSGDIVYSVFKELDYSTSLKNGPYANSGIGQAFQQANKATDANSVAFVDFAPYGPSYEDPAAFIASPIYDGTKKVGILIFQMPVDRLNEIMTYGQKWQEAGLGLSGETYLIAADKKMRSLGRLLVDDKKGYLETLKERGVSPDLIKTIDEKNTTIGLQVVDTSGAKLALSGQSGTGIFDDYHGVTVLSAYAPINAAGLKWAILSEVDEEEAFAPVAELTKDIITWSLSTLIIIALLIIFISMKYASIFVEPLRYIVKSLTSIAEDIDAGNADLTRTLQPPGKNELAISMAEGINCVLDKFADALKEFSGSTTSILSESQKVSNLSDRSSENMISQEKETGVVATIVAELSTSAIEVSHMANLGAEAAKLADNETQLASNTVNDATKTIQALASDLSEASSVVHDLERDSESIGSVLSVIEAISEQTNLLALNAAIEAARAGEHGRGFAVVADEVRNLSGRTKGATIEIKEIIDTLQNRSKEAVNYMNKGCNMAAEGVEKSSSAGKALSSIAIKVSEIDSFTANIAKAAQKQSELSSEVTENVNKISALTEHTTEGAKHTSQGCQELMTLSENLNKVVDQFKF